MTSKKIIPHDVVGDIAILKFARGEKSSGKQVIANIFLKNNLHISTILEKSEKISGRLRTQKLKFIAGEKKFETVHAENGCRFKLNVAETYFSPRLSSQRKLVAEDILKRAKNGAKILVMFAGVGPFPIVIARTLKNARKSFVVVSNELNRKASKFAEENIKLNKLENYVFVAQGDAKKISGKLKKGKLPLKYDFIVMPRPNLEDTFLPSSLKLARKGTIIYYHGFGAREGVLKEIGRDAGKKIKLLAISSAGEIAPYKNRWLAMLKAV